jgi:hypothetical protein
MLLDAEKPDIRSAVHLSIVKDKGKARVFGTGT